MVYFNFMLLGIFEFYLNLQKITLSILSTYIKGKFSSQLFSATRLPVYMDLKSIAHKSQNKESSL